jgi:hypothetical protein
MTQADQSDQSADRKGEVRRSKDKNPKLEGRIADEKDAELKSDGPAQERKRVSG